MTNLFWVPMVFVFGLIIGSFLNVVIYRFHTGKSLNGHSHCLSCTKRLRWYELLPVFSYLALRGRCSGCGSYIPSRYLWVELLTGVLFVCGFLTQLPMFWPLTAVILSILVIVTVYDLRHLIIPDSLVIVLTVLALSWQVFASHLLGGDVAIIIDAVLAALTLATPLFLLWLLSGGKAMGLGDPKLALPLGLLLGNWSAALTALILSFWIGAGISLLLLAYQELLKQGKKRLVFSRSQLTMKSEVPFAPFLILAFLVTWLLSINSIFTFINYVWQF